MRRPINSIIRSISLYNKHLDDNGIIVPSSVMLDYINNFKDDITVTESELLMILGNDSMSSTDVANNSLLSLSTAQNSLEVLKKKGYITSKKTGRTRLWRVVQK